jgi:hypothetical protein
MSDRNSAVFGIYSTQPALEAAVEALRAKGFRSADISVLTAPSSGLKHVSQVDAPPLDATPGTAGPGPAASVGGALGWLVGMSALAVAGGVFIVAGPLMAALARMGQAAGDVAGALAGFGVPELEAKRYEGRIVSGDMLLSVHTDDSEWFSQGKRILEQTGAEAITSIDPTLTAAVAVGPFQTADPILAVAPKSPPPGVLAAADRQQHRDSAARDVFPT